MTRVSSPVAGSGAKKPSAPDMFTESDDMFTAYFDVSAHCTPDLHCTGL